MGKSTISMVIFNSYYVSSPEGIVAFYFIEWFKEVRQI